MKRADYNLIAAVLRTSIEAGESPPKIAVEMASVFSRRGDGAPDFHPHEFINRCVPPRQRAALVKISPGRTPAEKDERPVLVESDASMFRAILITEFPEGKDLVGCAFSPSQSAKFSIGRVGSKVWIRFGGQAVLDPIGAVRAAAPDAIRMAHGQINAKEVRG